jgi:hypothetical protein
MITFAASIISSALCSFAGAIQAQTAPEPEVIYIESEPETIYIEKMPDGIYADCGLIMDEIQETSEGYLITITMQNGNRFSFTSEDGDLEQGEIISAVFNDMGTPEVIDDEIISYRYSGWISEEEMQHWIK